MADGTIKSPASTKAKAKAANKKTDLSKKKTASRATIKSSPQQTTPPPTPTLSLSVFVRSQPFAHRLAGFVGWCKSTDCVALPKAEWIRKLAEYRSRPVK